MKGKGKGEGLGLWAWWIELLARRETGECLAAMRIIVGVTVLYIVGVLVANDLVGVLYYGGEHGGYLHHKNYSWLVDALGGPSPTVAWGLMATTGLAGLALLLGIGARPAAFIAGQALLALGGINSMQGSYNNMVLNVLWLCVFARCDVTLSLACWIRTGSWISTEEVPAWPRMLGFFQLVLMYTWTGLAKISAYWVGDFSAIYYILQDPNWQRFDNSWAAYVYPLTQAMTATVWVWETTFGVVLLAAYFRETADRPGRVRAWFNRFDVRIPYALIGVGTHVTIGLLMVVGPFALATLAFYPCLFPPQAWRAGWRRVSQRSP